MILAGGLRLRALRELRARDMRALLDQEAAHWAEELDWDFQDVAGAIAEGIDGRTVSGHVVQDGARSLAYCYWLREHGRAVIGSLFAVADSRGQGLETLLLDAVLAEVQGARDCDRIEGQTLFSTAASVDESFTRWGFVSRQRHYLARTLSPETVPVPCDCALRQLTRGDLVEAAALIFESHHGSADAALNSIYSSAERTRQFVESLVLRDGCGRFLAEASLVAVGPEGLRGVVLASRLSRTNGHLCQVSVTPRAQGRGLGRVLVLNALERFERAGLTMASLSVTEGNDRACRLYEHLGFRLQRAYAAHAWVRPPERVWL